MPGRIQTRNLTHMFRACITIFSLLVAELVAAQARPNIIYIMADDLGYADLSSYGQKNYQTPHLDKLASEGIKFTNAYAGAPLCTPTRTSFMTGRYPARTPVGLCEPLDWTRKDSTMGLTPDYTSLPTLLKRSGYETFLVGKWHLGFTGSFSPNKNGFDEFFGSHGGGVDYISHTSPDGDNDLYENETPVIKAGYFTELIRDKAIDIIRRSHNKPFFLSLQFNAPHWPWQAPGDSAYPAGKPWKSGGSPATFAAMMKSMDDAVGAILQTLNDEKLAANTVVIFTSDNGGERYSNMGELSGAKPNLREGGIREPAFVRWPGKIHASTTTDQPIITMDWTATILALANAKPDPQFPLDGIDLMPVCRGKKKIFDRTFYWRVTQRSQQKAIRQGKWKFLLDEKGEYLFDLSQDAGEKNDLKEKETKVFARLKKKLSDWEKTVLTPVPLPKK
jgi:arylsulfatase A-like enzyme